MAKVTKKQVVDVLQAEDYKKGKKLGAGAIKHLKSIVRGKDWQLATKATYLAGLINKEGSAEVVDLAARSRKPALRVAAAAAAEHLSPTRAEPVLDRLLRSRIVGIRKCALNSVQAMSPKLEKRLKVIRKEDEERSLRTMAREAMKK